MIFKDNSVALRNSYLDESLYSLVVEHLSRQRLQNCKPKHCNQEQPTF